MTARLAQPAERKALNLVVEGSSPTVGALRFNAYTPTQNVTLAKLEPAIFDSEYQRLTL